MTPDLDRRLRSAFPLVFARPLNNDEPIRTGDGWFMLLWELCHPLELLITAVPHAERHHYYAQCVKEKFGGLRFYLATATAPMTALIAAAEAKSVTVCDVCGKTGKLISAENTAGRYFWVRTRCDEHSDWRQWKDGVAHGGAC